MSAQAKSPLFPRLAAAAAVGAAASGAALAGPMDVEAGVASKAESMAASIHELSEPDLKVFYLRCSQAAMQQALSGSEIALCSVGYELLLKRSFGGDFYALLAWSRRHPAGIAPRNDKPIERK